MSESLQDIRPVSRPQIQFLACPDRECGYGGSAYCGKTIMLTLDAVRQVDHPRYKALLLRRKRKELKEMIGYGDAIYLPLATKKGGWETGVTYTFPSGATIEMNSMEHEDDWQDYHGQNYTYLGYDELVTFTKDQYLSLTTWLRAVEEGLTVYIRWTSNPWPAAGGDGIEWIMDRFNIPSYVPVNNPIRTHIDKQAGISRMFIPAKPDDNKAVPPEAMEQWKAALKRDLDPDKYTAYIQGVWGVAPGRFFSRFSYNVHVVEPDEIEALIDEGLSTQACGMDHGKDVTCLLRGARLEDDRILVTDEYWHEERPILWHVPRIKEFASYGETGKRLLPIHADRTMWKIGEKYVDYTDKEIAKEYISRGVPLTRGLNDKHQGYEAIRNCLFFEDALEGFEEPMMLISSKCKNLIRELLSAQEHPTKPEDIHHDGRFHAIATLRYLAMHLYRPHRPKEEEKTPNIVRQIRTQKKREKMRREGLYA